MTASRNAAPWSYFVLLLLLSAPFWWIGADGGRLAFATFLPVSALMTFVPAIAALVLVYRERGAGRSRRFTIGLHGIWTPEEARREAKVLLGQVRYSPFPMKRRPRLPVRLSIGFG